MNWILKGGIGFTVPDLITREVCRVLRADQTLAGLMQSIDRVHVYAPNAGGALPRMVVSTVQRSETGKMSLRLKGEHRVGIFIEYPDPTGKLADEDPSIDSVLYHVQRVLDQAGRLEYEQGKRLSTIGPQFQPISGATIEGESIVCLWIGLEVLYGFADTWPARPGP